MYRGQWSPPVDQVLEVNFFPPGTPPGILVECGAGDGLTESCGKFFEDQGWTCINIEPDDERFAALCHNRCHIPGPNININLALSNIDSNNQMEFIRGPKPHHLTSSPCITWKTLVERIKLGINDVPKIDLFILDVEGHELKVIEGMKGASVLPKVICAEYPWPSTQLGPLTNSLAPFGYHLWFVSFNNAFYSLDTRPNGPFFGETRVYQPGELG